MFSIQPFDICTTCNEGEAEVSGKTDPLTNACHLSKGLLTWWEIDFSTRIILAGELKLPFVYMHKFHRSGLVLKRVMA